MMATTQGLQLELIQSRRFSRFALGCKAIVKLLLSGSVSGIQLDEAVAGVDLVEAAIVPRLYPRCGF